MAEDIKGFAEHYSAFTRRWKLALAVFLTISVIGTAVTLSLPDVYRSSAFILIEDSEIPEEILRTTVTTGVTQTITKLNERILTISNLVRIIEKYNLYESERESMPAELLAIRVREGIGIDIQTRDSIASNGLPRPLAVGFKVSFEDQNPKTAQLVAADLAEVYLEENQKSRSEQTTETSNYLRSEVSRLESEIAVLESELAEFKLANADTLPSLNPVNLQMLGRSEADIITIDRQLASLRDSRISIEAQLAALEPNVPTKLADGSMVMSPADQLKSLQTQLSVYNSRYSDDHPDVIRARKDIESLRNTYGLAGASGEIEESLQVARSNLLIAEERYTEDHPDVVRLKREVSDLEAQLAQATEQQLASTIQPDNPAYLQVQTSLMKLDSEERLYLEEQARLRRQMKDYEARLQQTPQVEKQLASMSRELASTTNRYWVMRDKQFSAEIGETLETNAKGEQLILIEPARLPLRPFKPDRGAILTLSFLFAVVCGLAITQLADALDSSIRGPAAITNIQGVPPLVEIPYIFNEAEIAQARRIRKIGLIATPAIAIIVAIIVHFTFLPLDVVWYTALQRLGL